MQRLQVKAAKARLMATEEGKLTKKEENAKYRKKMDWNAYMAWYRSGKKLYLVAETRGRPHKSA